jgi:uncharacterized protein (TIGR03067 family)
MTRFVVASLAVLLGSVSLLVAQPAPTTAPSAGVAPAATTAPSTAPAVPPAADTTPTSLEGTWSLVSAEFLDEKMSPAEVEGKRIAFRGNQMYMLDKGEEIRGDTDRGMITLDEKADPRQITLVDDDNPQQAWNGIFKVENGELTLVMSQPGMDRPTRFDAPGTMKMVLRKS